MWLAPFFMRTTTAAAFTASVSLKARSSHVNKKGGMLASCILVRNIQLQTYATDIRVSEAYIKQHTSLIKRNMYVAIAICSRPTDEYPWQPTDVC